MNKKTNTRNTSRKSRNSRSKRALNSINYESLENRRMLANFVVNSIGDDISGIADGQLTLREAIIAAETNLEFGDAVAGDADGDTIRFDSSIDGQTITLANGEFTITDDVSVLGGTSGIQIDAASLSRILNINSSEDVVVRDLSLVNGVTTEEGGAVVIAGMGTTVLNNVSIQDSIALGVGGGAISTTENTLTIIGSDLTGNTAFGASGSGGALLINSGDVRVVDSTLAANTANRAGGAIEIVDGRLELVTSTLGGTDASDGNIAGPMGIAAPGNGGGVHVTGSAGTEVFINGGLVSNNVAALEGGGLWNQMGSSLEIRSTSIFDNVAQGDAADDGGGGVFNNGGTTRIRGSIIDGNSATGASGSGGGIFSTDGLLSIIDTTVAANVANRAGGGIEIVDGSLFMLRSTLGGENSTDGNIAGPAGTAAPGNGGGLHVSGMNETSSIVRLTTISNNVAASEGGGLWNQDGSILRVLDSVVSNNVASGDAADNGGGAIFNNGGTTRVRNSSIIGNSADGDSGSGGGIFSTDGLVAVRDTTIASNVANRAGGGIEIVDGRLNFRNSILGGSSVEDGNIAGPDGSAAPGNGGGLHVSGSSETLTNIVGSQVENNVAASEGGGLWNQAGSTMTVRSGSVIRGNVASGDAADNGGGGIFNNGGVVSIDDAIVDENIADGASGSGGGLFSTAGIVTVMDSIFSENVANRAGGGIELIDGLFTMTDSFLSDNVAGPDGSANPGNGGGLHVSGMDGTVSTLENTIVSGNFASNEGGGLWNQAGSTLNLSLGSIVINNFAGAGGGGGLFNNGGIIEVNDSTLMGNDSDGDGGGIKALAGSTTLIESSILSYNSAANGGGFFNGGVGFVNNSVISFNDADTDGGGIRTDAGGMTTTVDSILFNNTPNDESDG